LRYLFFLWGFFMLAGVAQAQITINTTSLPDGKLNVAYFASLSATGGTPPYTWTVISGALPPGISLSTGGTISGTPSSVTGAFNFTVRASDGTLSAQQALTIKIPPVIFTTSLPNGLVNSAYSQSLTATTTTSPPLNWTLAMGSGPLPAGLSITDPVNGVISGTPTASGTSSFTIQVTDNAGQSATTNLSLTIQPVLAIPSATLPVGIVGAFYARQLVATGPPSPTWSVVSGVVPPGISLSAGGSLLGTPAAPGTFSFTVQAATTNPTQTAQQSFILVVNPALTITTVALPGATLNAAYPVTQLNATGGRAPYTWTNIGAPLPAGMTLTLSGVLSGIPTVPGNYTLTVQVSDTTDNVVPTQSAARNLSLTVAGALTITTATLPNGAVGTNYSQTLLAAAGTPPFGWTVVSGSLPDGLALSADGVISGTPATANTFVFTVSVTDSASPAQTATKSLSILIQPSITITTASPLPLAVVGAFYSVPLSATGPSPLVWSVISGIAPPGMTVTSTGSVAGTPSVAGTYDFTIQAAGGTPPQTGTKAFRIVVNAALSITTVAALPDAKLSVPYSFQLVATGGLPPYTWTTPGVMPPGLSLSSSGVVSGTPTTPGSFSFTAQVSDSFTPQQQVSRTFTLVVATTVTITTASLPNAIQNVPYSQQLQATGTGPFVWAVTSGTLPAGLTLTATGLLQGTPTVTGAQTFTITVTDARGATNTQSFTLSVDPPIGTLTVTSLPASLTPTQTADITLTIAAARPSPLSGQLILAFTSSAEVPSDDPNTQFSTGTRSVPFTFPAGQTTAVFASQVKLLTGTVAGTVTLTANFDNGPANVPVTTVPITATPPQMTNVTAVLTPSGMDVQITGYASSRRVTSAQFSFDIKNSKPISQTESVDAVFSTWYKSPASVPFGSSFSFVQSFVITGDKSTIQGVTVILTNAQGSTSSVVVKPQ
jgi:hypothetical protein